MRVEFGVMSSRYKMDAKDLETAKMAMVLFFKKDIPIAIYGEHEEGFSPREFLQSNPKPDPKEVKKAYNSIKEVKLLKDEFKEPENNHHLFTYGEIRLKLEEVFGTPEKPEEHEAIQKEALRVWNRMPQYKMTIKDHNAIHKKTKEYIKNSIEAGRESIRKEVAQAIFEKLDKVKFMDINGELRPLSKGDKYQEIKSEFLK